MITYYSALGGWLPSATLGHEHNQTWSKHRGPLICPLRLWSEKSLQSKIRKITTILLLFLFPSFLPFSPFLLFFFYPLVWHQFCECAYIHTTRTFLSLTMHVTSGLNGTDFFQTNKFSTQKFYYRHFLGLESWKWLNKTEITKIKENRYLVSLTHSLGFRVWGLGYEED